MSIPDLGWATTGTRALAPRLKPDMDRNGPFNALPAELIVIILSSLDFRSLLRCRQLSRFFNDLYESSASLQYKVELAVSGMQNGPPSTVTVAARLRLLRKHQESWNMLDWNRDENIIVTGEYDVWELSGGVFAQHRKADNTIVFWQLPSVSRGIEGKSWTVPLHGFKLRDLALDPGQDLLVVIENLVVLQRVAGTGIHLRTLSTGGAHPLAPNPPVITRMLNVLSAFESEVHYCIQIFADYIGILLLHPQQNQLVVLNWKTNCTELRLREPDLLSFAFLTERHLLLAISSNAHRLQVMDFKKGSPTSQPVGQERCLCSFTYPGSFSPFRFEETTIRSDPPPSWTPNNQLKVPFSVASDNRLFVISFSSNITNPVNLFVPLSTFVTHMNTIEEGQEGRSFTWHEWGPSGSRMSHLQLPSEVWVCHVFGTKFVAIEQEDHLVITVYDFNQLAYRRERNRTGWQTMGTQFISADDQTFRPGESAMDITTSLPHRKWTVPLTSRVDAVMCSEDNIIIVGKQRNHSQRFRILTI